MGESRGIVVLVGDQPTSLFRIAGVSKPVTATAVRQLVQDGQLSMSDRLVGPVNSEPLVNGQ